MLLCSGQQSLTHPCTSVARQHSDVVDVHQGLGLEGFAGLDLVYGGCHASQVELQQLLALLQPDQPQALESLLAAFPGDRHQALAMGVVWLAKLGVIRWITPEELR